MPIDSWVEKSILETFLKNSNKTPPLTFLKEFIFDLGGSYFVPWATWVLSPTDTPRPCSGPASLYFLLDIKNTVIGLQNFRVVSVGCRNDILGTPCLILKPKRTNKSTSKVLPDHTLQNLEVLESHILSA